MVNQELQNALGQSEAFIAVQERISRAARTERPVILVGERGTGKELAARRLHLLSRRWNQEYVTLNCASLSPTLIESELFGHEAGAFTGAVRLRKGRFEMAHGGSLFLDEVANIPMTAQEKILRTVEYGQMERVGGSATLEIDARLIAATNVDLRVLAREGRFREDLLDRLSFEVIVLPPLRARREDIAPLAAHFARRMAQELGLERVPDFTTGAMRLLLDHPWPGNIRELKNVVERMVYRCEGETIETIDFDPFESEFLPKRGSANFDGTDGPDVVSTRPIQRNKENERLGKLSNELIEGINRAPLPEAIRQLEFARLEAALRESKYHQRHAADLLGLSYHQFRACYRRLMGRSAGRGAL